MVELNRRYLADFDWVLLGLALAVALFGVVEISSVEPSPGLWRKQLMMIGIGVTIAFFTTFIDYRTIVQAAPFFYGVALVLLAHLAGRPRVRAEHNGPSVD